MKQVVEPNDNGHHVNFLNLADFALDRHSSMNQSLLNKQMNWDFQNQEIIIQGIDRSQVAIYASLMKNYGTKLVAGVGINTGKNISSDLVDIPIFDLVENAINAVGKVRISLIFVPPYQVLDAGLEAIAAGISNLIIVTPNVPSLDVIKLLKKAREDRVTVLGTGSSGIIIPHKFSWGTFDPSYFKAGKVGIISSGKYLIYEAILQLNKSQMGQSIAVSVGTDLILGSTVSDWLRILDRDKNTEIILLIQPAKNLDNYLIKELQDSIGKPVICYVFGCKSPEEKKFRDAVVIVRNQLFYSIPTIESTQKIVSNLQESGVAVITQPSQINKAISSFAPSS